MSDKSVITIEIRGHQKPALDAAHRISTVLLSSGLFRLRRTPGGDVAR
ncbi:hypothetical protein ACFWHQ_29840 [Streptomyces sp. NPDC060334]